MMAPTEAAIMHRLSTSLRQGAGDGATCLGVSCSFTYLAELVAMGIKLSSDGVLRGRFGTVLYWCSLAIAFACSIAATIILMAIIRGKLSGSEVWMAAEFFVAVGVVAVGVSRAVDSRL